MIILLELYYLWLNPNFNEAADDGEHVANDEQNIPAIDELHSVSPGYTAAKFVFEKLHILLFGEEEIATLYYLVLLFIHLHLLMSVWPSSSVNCTKKSDFNILLSSLIGKKIIVYKMCIHSWKDGHLYGRCVQNWATTTKNI